MMTGIESVQTEAESVRAELYERLPDSSFLDRHRSSSDQNRLSSDQSGSVFDHNRVHDAIDKVLATDGQKADDLRGIKRYLYQYRDTVRDRDIIQERYESLSSPLAAGEQRFMRDPTKRLMVAEDHASELPSVRDLLAKADQECAAAKKRFASVIGILEKDDQKTIVTAHFICGADLTWISTVYQHGRYWARYNCINALKAIQERLNELQEIDNIFELDMLIEEWKIDEKRFKDILSVKKPSPPLDDLAMLMALRS